MSLEALLLGTERRLRTGTWPWQCEEVGIQPTGRPPAVAGQQFLSVYSLSWSNLITESVEGFEEVYGIGICVTFRFGYAPADRTGRELCIAKTGLLAMARKVMYAVHGNYTLIGYANEEIPATENKIGEPLTFRTGKFDEKGPEWFEAVNAAGSAAGYAVDMRFEGGKRLQPLPL